MADFLTLLVSSQIYPPEDDFIVNIWCNNVVQKFLGIIKPAPFFEGSKKEKKRYQYFLFPLTTGVWIITVGIIKNMPSTSRSPSHKSVKR